VVAVLALAVVAVRSVYFLGTDSGGRVSLYRGLPYDLPLGIDFYSKQYSIAVQTDTLSPERQKVVTEHTMRSHGDAVDIIDDIEQREGSQPPATPPTATTPTTPTTTTPAPARKKRHKKNTQ
jgi:protein phosphatase